MVHHINNMCCVTVRCDVVVVDFMSNKDEDYTAILVVLIFLSLHIHLYVKYISYYLSQYKSKLPPH